MEQIQVARREIKYQMSLLQFKRFETRLSAALARDSYAGEDGSYPIRTLYFDTPYETDYYATMCGEEVRKKLRMRCYSPADKVVKLERKTKFGQDQVKTGLNLTREQAQEIIAGNYQCLTQMEEEFPRELYVELNEGGYRPNLMLEYRRIAFVAPANHIRVTFDYKIGYTKSTLDLFALSPAMVPISIGDGGILEVKYDRFLFSYIKDILREADAMQTAYGKYVVACTDIY